MMKLLKISTVFLLGLSSAHVFAGSNQDLIAQQSSAEQFLSNYKKVLSELSQSTDKWLDKPSESPQIWLPICIGYENRIAILKNNVKYKKQFNQQQLQTGDSNFDELLADYEAELQQSEEICQKAKQSIQ